MGKCALILAGLLIALCPRPVAAETIVQAGTYGSETWTEAGSPYIVSGSVTFDDLTIEAGSSVLVANDDPLVTITAPSFVVSGTEDKGVILQGDDSTASREWGGVSVTGVLEVAFATFRDANISLRIGGAVDGSAMFSTFDSSSAGMEVTGARLRIDGCTFSGRGNGILHFQGGELDISNSLFLGSTNDGVACNGPACKIEGSTFHQNRFGVYTNRASVEISNCIFSENTYAVQTDGGVVTVEYSNLWQNDFDFDHRSGSDLITEGDGNLFVDPLYRATDDYHLSETSPCIDAGGSDDASDHDREGTPRPLDGDGSPDADGSELDMGAYEYDPGADTGGSGGAGGDPGETGGGGAGVTGGADTGTGGGGTGIGGSGASGGAGGSAGAGGAMSGAGGGSIAGSSATGAGGVSGNTSGETDPKATRLSKGCGCGLVGDGRGPQSWLFFFVGLSWLLVGKIRQLSR